MELNGKPDAATQALCVKIADELRLTRLQLLEIESRLEQAISGKILDAFNGSAGSDFSSAPKFTM